MTRRERYYQRAHDERVEPNRDLIPGGMPDPDWGAVEIQPNQKRMAVGDPTLWANTVITPVDDAFEGNTPRAFYGEQIVLVQANDRYSRSWSISGSLGMRSQQWAEAGLAPSGPFFDGNPTRISVFLSILQGIEKIKVEQQICLMAGGDPTNIGLCNNQCTTQGGPYVPTFNDTPPTEASLEFRAFAAVGALIGNTISVRPLIVRAGLPGNQGQVPFIITSCLLTPYAPGSGI